ncbi:GntR family transcriptional regulator [Marinovum sp. 2_MG-2023]|uniref:GntR family transcriptional regulator n=1 Tax=Roseobacteraceae TaxID=2854170 RepID=UPI001FD1842F|nr:MULTISPECIES: GntR family transcriptional regulator [Roseobacteraceae]MCJ7872889.1 GntR family transcriptional regulator [Phaeobacter sp. J2-8]MDO6732654.1 GntR family transcriptional regulator [Marinovum sp. 2_MG-2023]MDO6781848.1 GntR family transcriptional regulator [Marinovum sp. 1_MG-2023]
MAQVNHVGERRTTVDAIFDDLYDQIATLALRPGDKLSEADIATKFGVSRQPVRDAFSRLANLDLLLIRPQRATEVRRFSIREIEKSRFVRASVEAEVLRRAAANCDDIGASRLDIHIARQRRAIEDNDYEAFGVLDYDFHQALCEIAKVDFAFEVISSEKAKVDRLCMLGLSKESRMPELLADHEEMAKAVKSGDAQAAVDMGMLHLSRLDATIASITQSNADYFEPMTH